MKTVIIADAESEERIQLDRTINNKKPSLESGAILIQNCVAYSGSNQFVTGTLFSAN